MLSSLSHSTAAASPEEGEGGGQEGCLQPSLPALSPLSRALFSAARGVSKATGWGSNYRIHLPRAREQGSRCQPGVASLSHGCRGGGGQSCGLVRGERYPVLQPAWHYKTWVRMGLWSDKEGAAWPLPPPTHCHADVPLFLGNLRPSLAHTLHWIYSGWGPTAITDTQQHWAKFWGRTDQYDPVHSRQHTLQWGGRCGNKRHDCYESGKNKFEGGKLRRALLIQ